MFIGSVRSLFSYRRQPIWFKKDLGCAHNIYSATKLIEHFIKGNSTVNLCALDISKAYDTVNHCGLLLKLIDRNVPLCFFKTH